MTMKDVPYNWLVDAGLKERNRRPPLCSLCSSIGASSGEGKRHLPGQTINILLKKPKNVGQLGKSQNPAASSGHAACNVLTSGPGNR